MSESSSVHVQWSSRLTFILAATGSAVGLGNIWKFPYIAGENGGGAFVLVYLLCIALVGLPIMMAEVLIGRRGRQSPINAMSTLAKEAGASRSWWWLGAGGILAGMIILSYYSVIAGWTMAYIFRTFNGLFTGMTGEGASSIFVRLVSDPERLLAWHTLFMVITSVVVVRGVRSGLEQAIKVLMPVLLFLLLVLVYYAHSTGEFGKGMDFLFTPDFSRLTTGGILLAMGHAFFTLSLGLGAMMVYGSYLPDGIAIGKTSIAIALMDTVIALLAGLAIFPIVFANDLSPAAGPGLIFHTLPIAFGHMPMGFFFGGLFFILLVFAALSSAISLMEPMVAWLKENRGIQRTRAVFWSAILAWVLGIVTIMSFSQWTFEFSFAGELKNNGMFDLLDILTSAIMLPIGGLAIALFAGWVMKREAVSGELGTGIGFHIWYIVIRFITPAAMLVIFVHALGLLG